MEWLGCVPEHWQVMAIKHVVATPITDGPHETPDFFDGGVPFVSAEAVSSGKIDFDKIRGFISKADHERYSQKYLPKRGDIFMIKSGATTGVTAIVETDAEFNIWSPLAVIRCNEGSNPYFVLNFMRSRSFQEAVALSWSYGTQQNIGMGVIGNLSVTVPPVEEQQSIAAHLDRETARIDALAEKKTRFIELLREKRQALITHAVTKGLDPNVKMKDSGVEWLGEVPVHWAIKKLKYLCRVQTGDKDTVNAIDDGEYPFFVRSQTVEKIGSFTADCEAVLTAGDGVGVGKVFHYYCGKFDFHQRVYMFNQFSLVEGRFFYFYLLSNFHKVALDGGAKSTVDSLRLPLIQNFDMTIPSVSEQRKIVDFIEAQCGRLDVLISRTEQSISLLIERRSALITAAVTGQIDLRAAI